MTYESWPHRKQAGRLPLGERRAGRPPICARAEGTGALRAEYGNCMNFLQAPLAQALSNPRLSVLLYGYSGKKLVILREYELQLSEKVLFVKGGAANLFLKGRNKLNHVPLWPQSPPPSPGSRQQLLNSLSPTRIQGEGEFIFGESKKGFGKDM